jgi:Uma2 family endonuclease
MAMPASEAVWTSDMLDRLPDDGNRYEIIGGELFVTPSPSYSHQSVVGALYARLRSYLRPFSIARAVISPSDVRTGDASRNRVQPDVFVVRMREGAVPPSPFELGDLLLAIEVESWSNAAYDFQTKRELYLRNGVPEYWVASPEARTIARWRGPHDPAELLTDTLVWHPGGMAEPLILALPEFFDDALG